MIETYPHPILILFAHPALQKSRVNKRLIRQIEGLPGVTFHDLYEVYHDFHIIPKREQDLLLTHEIIIFQYPFFWFNMPALLKEWQDLVLQHGWAYGRDGMALKGKKFLVVLSTGGRESLYQLEGFYQHRLSEFLLPLERMACLCQMEYLPPFVVHGTYGMSEEEIGRHAEDYRRLLILLRDGRIDYGQARKYSRINEQLDRIILP